jgi:hypothetical protein
MSRVLHCGRLLALVPAVLVAIAIVAPAAVRIATFVVVYLR